LLAEVHLSYEAPRLVLQRLHAASRGIRLHVRGELDTASGRLEARLNAHATALRPWLRAFALPPAAGGLHLTGRLRGRWYNPTAQASLQVSGLPAGPLGAVAVRARARLADGRLTLSRLTGRVAGGELLARGDAQLYPADLRAERPPPRYRLRGRLRGASLARLGDPRLAGRLSAWIRVSGQGARPTGRVRVEGQQLTLFGERWRGLHLRARLHDGGILLRRLEIRRVAGGRLRVKGRVRRDGRLDLEVSVARLPLQSIPGLNGDGGSPPVAGTLALPALRVRGPYRAPTLEGTLRVEGLRLRGQPVGKVRLRFTPTGRRTAVTGPLGSRLRVIAARLDPRQRSARIHLRLEGLDVVRYLPELERHGVVSTAVSADVRARLRLQPWRLEAHVQGEQLVASLQNPPAERREKAVPPGASAPAAVYTWRAVDGFRLRWQRQRLHLERLVLRDDLRHRRLAVRGWLEGNRHQLRLEGNLSLQPLTPLLGDRVDHLQGTLGVSLTSRGRLARPRLTGTLLPAGIRLRLAQMGEDVIIPAGRIELSAERWELSKLRVYVGNSHLALGGGIGLRQGRPRTLDLSVHGTVRPGLLVLVPGRVVRSAWGEPWQVDARIKGSLRSPRIAGKLALARTTIVPYSLPYDLELRGGELVLSGARVELKEVRGRLGGAPFSLEGRLRLGDGGLQRVSLQLQGEAIPVRAGPELRVQVSPSLTVRGAIGEGSALAVGGKLLVVGGRYARDFELDPAALLLSRRRVDESRPPVWERIPWLGRTRMDINVVVQRFRVDNNVADLKLMGNLNLAGRLSQLQINGMVEALGGTFQIPLLRGKYTLVTGRVDFDRGRAAGRDNPWIHLRGVTTVSGSGQEHRVTLQLKGLLSELQPKWWTDTGLRQKEVLALLAGINAPSGLGAGGVSLRTLTPLFGKALPGELQMAVGVQSVGLEYEQRLGSHVRLRGEASFGYAGQQAQVGEVVLRLHDRITLRGRALRRISGEEVTEENDTLEGQAELRYRIRLRGGLRRALGF